LPSDDGVAHTNKVILQVKPVSTEMGDRLADEPSCYLNQPYMPNSASLSLRISVGIDAISTIDRLDYTTAREKQRALQCSDMPCYQTAGILVYRVSKNVTTSLAILFAPELSETSCNADSAVRNNCWKNNHPV